MKRNLIYLAALSALALTACSQDEAVNEIHPVAESSIGFRTNLDRSTVTRAGNEITSANISSFTVAALNEDNSLYFHKLQVTKEGTADPYKWTYSPPQVWPRHGLQFFGISDSPSNTLQEKPADSDFPKIMGFQPHIGYMWDGKSALPTGTHTHHDLLGAYYAGTEAHGSVEMNFQHLLSQIEVQAKNTNTATRTVEVIGVRIMNLTGGGDFDFGVTQYALGENGAAVNALPAAAAWKLNSVKADYFFRYPDYKTNGNQDFTPTTLTETPQNLAPGKHNFMVIPQTTTAWNKDTNYDGTYISVACRVRTVSQGPSGTVETTIYPPKDHEDAYKVTVGDDVRYYAMAMVPVAFDLKAGMKYTYILDFSNGSGLIDPNNPDNPQSPDIDPNPGDKGDEIEGTPIDFTVSVTEWKTPAGWNDETDMDKANGTN